MQLAAPSIYVQSSQLFKANVVTTNAEDEWQWQAFENCSVLQTCDSNNGSSMQTGLPQHPLQGRTLCKALVYKCMSVKIAKTCKSHLYVIYLAVVKAKHGKIMHSFVGSLATLKHKAICYSMAPYSSKSDRKKLACKERGQSW
ncbi:hypothetical protein ACA910_001193 [Epithemia clementina (nom. ined.)]